MTKLKCPSCEVLNPQFSRYEKCINCRAPLFNAEEVDV